MNAKNIFNEIPSRLPKELIQEIATCDRVCIERILSKGHCSEDGFWYDQSWDEWVMLVQGAAGLEVTGRPDIVALGPGDHLMIPAGVKHRVAWTAAEETTVWLAVHIGRPNAAPHPSDEQPAKERLYE